METTTTTITLPVDGDGTALKLEEGVSKFGLVKVEASAGTVQCVRDPDNPGENTIFEVEGAGTSAPGITPPGTTVTLTLTYAGE
jgi:hypothetical protein